MAGVLVCGELIMGSKSRFWSLTFTVMMNVIMLNENNAWEIGKFWNYTHHYAILLTRYPFIWLWLLCQTNPVDNMYYHVKTSPENIDKLQAILSILQDPQIEYRQVHTHWHSTRFRDKMCRYEYYYGVDKEFFWCRHEWFGCRLVYILQKVPWEYW